jgi:23S rRNA pseudouridine1911/1915/1917 synthase
VAHSPGEVVLDRTVEEADAGRRIDQLLADWLAEPRGRIQERLAREEVLVGGAVAAKSRRVAPGDRVEVHAAAAEEEPEPPPPVPVRHRDDHVAVVAKPAGLVVHAGAGTRSGTTLVDALRAMGVPLVGGDDPRRPGIVHRLDRGTSGLLVVATSTQAYHGLVATFARHDVDREYWALTEGVPAPPHATIDAPIARAPVHRTRFIVDAGGRPAVSHYDVRADHGVAAELAVSLETGRTHQVRVHLSAVGHPIVGDPAYGAGRLGAEVGLARPALHARRLGFAHPVTGERVEVTEPLPDDLVRAVAALVGGP